MNFETNKIVCSLENCYEQLQKTKKSDGCSFIILNEVNRNRNFFPYLLSFKLQYKGKESSNFT